MPETKSKSLGSANRLVSLMDELLSQNRVPHQTNRAEWTEAVDLLLLDHDAVEIEEVIRYGQRSEFWKDRVRSMPKLRLHYEEMAYQVLRDSPSRPKSSRAVDEEEIRRRVAHYRENIAGAESHGEPLLHAYEVDWLCAEYAAKLRNRR